MCTVHRCEFESDSVHLRGIFSYVIYSGLADMHACIDASIFHMLSSTKKIQDTHVKYSTSA